MAQRRIERAPTAGEERRAVAPRAASWLSGARWQLLSVPIRLKILGVGGIVALLFGLVTIAQVRAVVTESLEAALGRSAAEGTAALALRIERPMVTGDELAVRDLLRQSARANPDVRSVGVCEISGAMGPVEGEGAVASLCLSHAGSPGPSVSDVRFAQREGSRLVVATAPILGGELGQACMVVSDESVRRQVAAVSKAIAWALLLCVLVGQGLALLLASLITRPIRDLVAATKELERGAKEPRARLRGDDEIGELARSFNHMAAVLEHHRRQLERREIQLQHLVGGTIAALEGERKRIARELHDQLGQSLTNLLLLVRSFGNGASATSRAEIEQRVQELIEEARRLAWELRPSILDDYGLASALGRHVERVRELSGIAVDFEHVGRPGGQRLSDPVELVLFRVAQEAITNALRHAAPRHVGVVLLQRDAEVVLIVEDDGTGFDAQSRIADRAGESLGLLGMQERLGMLGGELTIESSPGHGTTVRATLPVDAEHP